MSVLHVSIDGLDRRSLTALGTRHRIVVVGHRENARTRKITIDAYVTPRQESWLQRHGYGVTTVTYDWNIVTTKRWMNLLAPVAKPFFQWNHDVVMEWGRECLEKKLRR